MEEPALGLTKSQDLLLHLLLALPTLAIHAIRRRQPERETPGTLSPAFALSSPHAPGKAPLGRVHQLPGDQYGTCLGALFTIIHVSPLHLFFNPRPFAFPC